MFKMVLPSESTSSFTIVRDVTVSSCYMSPLFSLGSKNEIVRQISSTYFLQKLDSFILPNPHLALDQAFLMTISKDQKVFLWECVQSQAHRQRLDETLASIQHPQAFPLISVQPKHYLLEKVLLNY